MSILVSRFILDLRDKCVFSEAISSRSLHFSHIDTVRLASPQTSRFVGNLGGSLEFGGDEEEKIWEDHDDTELIPKRV